MQKNYILGLNVRFDWGWNERSQGKIRYEYTNILKRKRRRITPKNIRITITSQERFRKKNLRVNEWHLNFKLIYHS